MEIQVYTAIAHIECTKHTNTHKLRTSLIPLQPLLIFNKIADNLNVT